MAHRDRVDPTPDQLSMLARQCADARDAGNPALEQANYYRPGRPMPGSAERSRQLTEARKGTWLGEGSSSVQQQTLRDFDQARRNWWAGTHRRPRWRQAGLDKGVCIRDVKVQILNRRWATRQVPTCGPVRVRLSRPLPAEHGMARVTSDRSRRWHVSFSVPQPVLERTPTGAAVGLDAGVVATVTTSDGRMFHAPGLRPGETRRLRRLPRKLARQEKGSTRRDTTKTAIARRKAKEADRRRDLIEQTTTAVVRDFAAPGAHVAATRGLNRAISAPGWSRRRRRLVETATTCGVVVVAVNPAHTSGRCAAGGHTSPENRTSHAVFGCRAGGHEANADVNTAENILAAGLAVIVRGGTSQQGPDDARSQPVAG